MNRLIQWIINHSKLIICIILVLTTLGFLQIGHLKVEDNITQYLSKNDPEIRFYQQISNQFKKRDKNLTMISLEYPDTLFTLENLQNFKLVIEELDQSDLILSVSSFLNMPKIIGTDFSRFARFFLATLCYCYFRKDGYHCRISHTYPDDILGNCLWNLFYQPILWRKKLVSTSAGNTKSHWICSVPYFYECLNNHVSFFSLITTVVRPMTEFGILSTIGILLAFFLVFFFGNCF